MAERFQIMLLLPLSFTECGKAEVLASADVADLVSLYGDDLPAPAVLDTELHRWSAKWPGRICDAAGQETSAKVSGYYWWQRLSKYWTSVRLHTFSHTVIPSLYSEVREDIERDLAADVAFSLARLTYGPLTHMILTSPLQCTRYIAHGSSVATAWVLLTVLMIIQDRISRIRSLRPSVSGRLMWQIWMPSQQILGLMWSVHVHFSSGGGQAVSATI